jgi:hypothetical protein
MAKTRDFRPTTPASFRNSDNDVIEVDSDNPMPVSATITVGTSGIATSAKQDTLDGHVTAMSAKLPAALGQTTGAASMSVVPASDAGLATAANQTTGNTALTGLARTPVVDSATQQRPNDTTAYTANDAVADSTTAGSVTPFSWALSDTNDAPVLIRSATITTNGTAAGTASVVFRLHLFRASPTAVAGDNAAWAYPAIASGYLGSLSGTSLLCSDGSVAILYPDGNGQDILARPVSGGKTIYGLLQTLTAFTPAAQATKTITLKSFQGRA